MFPAYDPIAVLCVVLVCTEATGLVFKLDSNALLTKPGLLIGHAIRISSLNPLYPQAESWRDAGEEEYNAEVVQRCVLERAVIENLGPLLD